jgi:hypothetical protein
MSTHSISYSIPTTILGRLARLPLAADASASGPLRHVALRVTADQARFSATDGRILASLTVAIGDLDGPGSATDLILDGEQVRAACAALAKSNARRVVITCTGSEARFTAGHATAIVRLHEGAFPQVGHVWSRPADQRWVPAIGSLDPALVAIAQRIAGKPKLLFVAPVVASTALHRLWQPATPRDETVSLADLQSLLRQPAYWSDGELAILVMPVARSADERALDLSRFGDQASSPIAAAA